MSTTETTATATDVDTLVEDVRARAAEVGYAVTRTADGFTVQRELADARYWTLMAKAGVKTLTGHEVTLDPERRTAKVSDVQRDVEWRAGNDGLGELRPFFAARSETTRGRVLATGTTRSWGVREDGSLGTIEDYAFDTAEGRGAVRAALDAHGWREEMPLDQKIGLVVAVVTVVLLVLCFGTWGVVALLG